MRRTLMMTTAAVGVIASVAAAACGNSSIWDSRGVGYDMLVRHYRKGAGNSSEVRAFRPTVSWNQFAMDVFKESRPFTKEESKVHGEILKSMSSVFKKKVFDI